MTPKKQRSKDLFAVDSFICKHHRVRPAKPTTKKPKPSMAALKRAERCADDALTQLTDPTKVHVIRADLQEYMDARDGWDSTPGATRRLREALKGQADGQ